MEELIETTSDYPFDDLSLQTPQSLQGGSYLAKLCLNDEPVIFQTPKCKTKKGIHKSGKKTYCDLLLSVNNDEFIEWIYSLEKKIQELIYEKKDYWFVESDLTLDDIEYNWVTTVKTYKKQYLIRTFINKNKDSTDSLQIYNENQDLINDDEITSESTIVSIVEISGLKFSATSFHLELNLKQAMVLPNKPKFKKCMIKLNSSKAKKVNIENKTNTINNEETLEKNDSEDEDENESETIDDNNKINEENQDTLVENELISNEEEPIVEANKEVNEDVNKEVNEDVNKEVNEDAPEEADKEIKKELDSHEIVSEDSVLSKQEIEDIEKEKSIIKNEKEIKKEDLKNDDHGINEIQLNIPKNEKTINLKKPNEVYLDIYKTAREKAKECKKEAIKAYLLAKKIKQTYLLDESEISDTDSDDDFLFSES